MNTAFCRMIIVHQHGNAQVGIAIVSLVGKDWNDPQMVNIPVVVIDTLQARERVIIACAGGSGVGGDVGC